MDEQSTLQLAQRGDRAAREALLRRFQDTWYRYCLSALRDPDRAADATQETALRFLRQLAHFRGESQLQTWSLGIALNVCREQKRRRITSELSDDNQFMAEHGSAGFDTVETNEQATMLKQTLNTLPDRQREALVLRFFEELSVEQTAAAMGCAVGTVKATVHQALRALKQKMTSTS